MEILDGIRGGIAILGLPAFAIVVIGIVGFMVWKRTRSTHSLMARLWLLFHGKKECKDPIVREFFDEQAALMEFRFTTGVQVRTRRQAHEVIKWTRAHNEDIGDVAGCGSYFDLERTTLKEEDELPSKLMLIGRAGLAIAIALIVALFTLGVFSDSAGLRMKKSGTFFSLSTEYAKPLWSGSGLSKVQCMNDQVLPNNGFTNEDAKTLCEILKNKSIDLYLEKTVKQQRITCGLGVISFAWYFCSALGWLMSGLKARTMLKRLMGRDEGTEPSLAT